MDARERAMIEHASAQIRMGLLATKGARICPLKPCMVITQGGAAGEFLHREVVHYGREWFGLHAVVTWPET